MLQIVIYKKLNFWEEYTPLAVGLSIGLNCANLQLSPLLSHCALYRLHCEKSVAFGGTEHLSSTFAAPP